MIVDHLQERQDALLKPKMRKILLETGDNNQQRIKFQVTYTPGEQFVSLGFVGKTTCQNPLDTWTPLRTWNPEGPKGIIEEIIEARQKRGWNPFSCPDPLDVLRRNENVKHLWPILDDIRYTPEWQLFLASLDFSFCFGLTTETDRRFEAKALVLDGRPPAVAIGTSVRLCPNAEGIDPLILSELVDYTRFCKLVVNDDIVRYYVPYAVPYDHKVMSAGAIRAWSELSDQSYNW